MTHRELEEKIGSSYRNTAPDIWDSVLTNCDSQKGQIIMIHKKKDPTSFIRHFGALAAALLIVIGGLSFYRSSRAVTSTVMLDSRSGIGIRVDENEKVLDVQPYNGDAEALIGGMDFSGCSLEVAVNALIGSMLRSGYISEEANSILISVDSSDPAAEQALRTRLTEEINAILESVNLSGAMLIQTLTEDEVLQKLAEQYGITLGKAKLIDQITKQNALYTFADLVPLTINDLNLISESGGTNLENVESIGTASSSSYIGKELAQELALKKAQVSADEVLWIHCKLDQEKGRMIYEVDFDIAGYEIEVELDALNGDIVKFERETDRDQNRSQSSRQNSSGKKYGNIQWGPEEAAAISAALLHAGVDESKVTKCKCEEEHKRGVRIFEVEFTAGGYEYEYEIDAASGKVLTWEKERD